MCTIDEDHMMYGSWDIRHNRQNILFWVIFCPLTLLANQKIKIWKKNEKRAWRYHHFTQLYQKYPEIGRIADVIVIFHFFAFYSLTAQKIKIWKKRKTHQEVSWFYKSVPKIMIIRYNYSEIWCVTDVIVIFHFGLFFAMKKKRKSARRYHHFTHGYQKLWSNNLPFLRYGVWQTDGQMDGQMDGRSDIQRWVPQLSMKDC